MRRVYVAGLGSTRYGRLEKTARALALEAAKEAVLDAGINPKEIQAGFASNVFGFLDSQAHIGPLIMSGLGIPDAPCSTIESACSSGASAFREAWINIASGIYDAMLVVGSEKISQMDTDTATTYFTFGGDYLFEGSQGATFPGLYATVARAYMQRYNIGEQQLALVAVKNHSNGLLNPRAHIRKAVTVDDVMNSPVVASPLKLLDCCPFSDGAAAAVLCTKEHIDKLGKPSIYIAGSGRAGGSGALHSRNDLTTLSSTVLAAKQAYEAAAVSPGDINLAEVHDAFTIAEVIAMEDLGLTERGKAIRMIEKGETQLQGILPVNPSGGLKSKGHPVGATGLGQIVEVYDQLARRAGARQVNDVNMAVTHSVGATGASCNVHILSKEN